MNSQVDSFVFCWGGTVNGELGLGGIEEDLISKPQQLNTFDKVTSIQDIACGRWHTVAILKDGRLFSCGNNDYGQLGHNVPRRKFEPISSMGAHRAWLVSCGESHTITVTTAGEAFSWGCNGDGQLGVGTDEEVIAVPKLIKSLAVGNKVVQVACGYRHSLALVGNGTLYAWGQNQYGQLGIGTESGKRNLPCEVSSLQGLAIAQIAAGGHHSIVLTKSGALFAWGKNTFGQLGIGDCDNRFYPTQLKTMRYQKVKFICCGEDHSVALTQTGGVFTFGAGMYGQLGHCSKSNEVLPRQVIELMGSMVTQIASGRCHTLAYVPTRGRIYAFGLGGNGQLGTGNPENRNGPVIVLGPWVHHSKDLHLVPAVQYESKIARQLSQIDFSVDKDDDDDDMEEQMDCTPDPTFELYSDSYGENKYIIHKILCGGNQNFVISTLKQIYNCAYKKIVIDQALIEPLDFRTPSDETQILVAKESIMQELSNVPEGSSLPIEAICDIETTFTSVSCLNGSFLKENDEHYGCNSKNPGVSISSASGFFKLIEHAHNSTVPDLIYSCLKEMFQKLNRPPPDIEALRIFIILPLSHLFHNTSNIFSLIWPFSKILMKLSANASKVIDIWWSNLEEKYYRNLIQIFTNSIAFLLKTESDKYQRSPTSDQLRSFLEILLKLNKINISSNLIVPYQEFCIPEVTENINVTTDYIRWLRNDQSINGRGNDLCFCDYPFVFDAHAKTMILQTDSQIQMEAASINSCRLAFSTFPILVSNPFLILQVDRDRLVQTTIEQLGAHRPTDLKKPLKVIFTGEDAVDAGGVRKEFFLILLKEMLDPKYGMFIDYPETHCIWFNQKTFEEETMYHIIGMVCGLAIYNFTIIDLPFPLVLYKKLLDETVKLEDLRGLSPMIAKNLQDLLDYAEDDFEDVFRLNFEISMEIYGETVTSDLKANGKHLPVTKENRQEFVDCYVNFMLNESIASSFVAFSKGFHKVCGSRVLALFHAQELMELVVGNENYQWGELEETTEYKNGYNKDDIYVRRFWKVFHSLEEERKKKFLLFLTGSDRIPILGMKAVKIIIQPMHVNDDHLPVAHTCYNMLDLPKYSNEEILRKKLLQAIEHTKGFGLA